MPDETPTTVAVDGVTWDRAGRTWATGTLAEITFATKSERALLSRIAALEAEREEIERAMARLEDGDVDIDHFDTGWFVGDYSKIGDVGDPQPTALAALLAWHRDRGEREGRDT